MVAADAGRRRFRAPGRHVMAIGALQPGVCAAQREMGFPGMIEVPQRPPVGRVTALAFLAETALVHVFMRMAIDTRRRRVTVRLCRVALRTADHAVQADERVPGDVVIEDEVRMPGFLPVAGIAAAVQLAAMRILAAMTADAILG